MSIAYYARKVAPRKVYDEYEIGHSTGGTFFLSYNEDNLHFPDIQTLIDFIQNTKIFKFYDEYERELTPEAMVEIIEKSYIADNEDDEDDDE